MSTPQAALLEALPSPYDWCYECDGPYGTRKFSPAPHNGSRASRSVALFSEEQMRAYGEACARAAIAQAEAAMQATQPQHPAPDALRELCAAAHQVVRAAGGPVAMLDNLAAVAAGQPMLHTPVAGLPWVPAHAACQHGTPRRYACESCEAALATGAWIESSTRAQQPVSVPLTEEQISAIPCTDGDGSDWDALVRFARAIERAHGIAAPQTIA